MFSAITGRVMLLRHCWGGFYLRVYCSYKIPSMALLDYLLFKLEFIVSTLQVATFGLDLYFSFCFYHHGYISVFI